MITVSTRRYSAARSNRTTPLDNEKRHELVMLLIEAGTNGQTAVELAKKLSGGKLLSSIHAMKMAAKEK